MGFSFSNSSIKVKFLTFFIPFAIIFIIVVVEMFYNLSLNQIEESEIILLKSRTDEFKDLMRSYEKSNLNIAAFISNMEGVKAAYAEPDNEVGFKKLQAVINPVLSKLNIDKKKFQLHFHKPPAISFWRIFSKKRNDDVSAFRKTIVKTYETKKPVVGLEHGVYAFGLRSISPIFNDKNEYVGSVELITDMPEILSILNKDKEDSVQFMNVANTEYLSKFVSDEYMSKNYPNTVGDYKVSKVTDPKFDVNSIITDERISRILDSEQSEFELINNYVVGFMPIIDFDNNKPGLFVLSVDIEKQLSETKNNILIISFIIIIAFVIIIGGMYISMNKIIIKPISEAKQRILDLSEGKF